MDCSRTKALLDEYFEGLLSPPQAQVVADHVSACPACAAELHQIEKVAAALAAVPQALPDAQIPAIIAERVAALPAPDARRRAAGWRRLGVAAAGSLAGLSAVAYALPLLVSQGLAAPLLTSLADAAAAFQSWLGVLPSILGAFWEAVLELVRRLGLALDAAAPTLGTYAAAEIGILAALFFVLQVSRRRRAHQQVTLI
jgi:anti-sigma factor RsiW